MRTYGWIAPLLAGTLLLGPVPESQHPCAHAERPCTGSIEVPLDWADPDGERIEVGFRWIPRADLDSPARGTVLAHAGGSGESIPGAASR